MSTSGAYTLPVWKLTANIAKNDFGLAFGNPDSLYFVHFMNIDSHFIFSQISVLDGTLMYQWSYNPPSYTVRGLLAETVSSVD